MAPVLSLWAATIDRLPELDATAPTAVVLWVTEAAASSPSLPRKAERIEPATLRASEVASTPAAACLLDLDVEKTTDLGAVLSLSLPAARWFGGEALQSHLFLAGFEAPSLRPEGRRLVVTVRRSRLAPPPQRTHRLSVIMPAYNEAATFTTTMDQVLAKQIPGMRIEIIVVESNSTDGTREKVLPYAEHPRVRLILEDRPRGKGHAVRTGLAAADGDFVLIQDADMEYDIDDYEVLLAPLRAGEVGFVLGMRTSPSGSRGLRDFGQFGLRSRVMNLGHIVFLTLFNTVYGQRLRDPFTMYKVFRRDCMHGLVFECNRFDFDWELTGKLIRAGYTPREIPVTYRSRSFSEGKKVSFFKDPMTWVKACFKYRFAELYPQRPDAIAAPSPRRSGRCG
jgi:hypothetical protein